MCEVITIKEKEQLVPVLEIRVPLAGHVHSIMDMKKKLPVFPFGSSNDLKLVEEKRTNWQPRKGTSKKARRQVIKVLLRLPKYKTNLRLIEYTNEIL